MYTWNSSEIKPDDHQAWYNRGKAFLNSGKYEEAIESYGEALKFQPDNSDYSVGYNNACSRALQKKTIEAIDNLRQSYSSLRANPPQE